MLATALIPHLEPALDDAFGSLRHGRRGIDLGLVAELLDLDRSARLELVDALDPDRPLLAMRLLAVEPGEARLPLQRAIQIPLDVLPLLAGRGELSSTLRRSATMERMPAGLAELIYDDVSRARLTEAVVTLGVATATPSPPWIVLWGPRGAGKRTIAGRIAAAAGRRLLAVDTETIVDGSGNEQLRRAQREALLHDAVLYIGPVAGELAASGARDLVRRLRDFPGALVFGFESTQAPRFASPRPVHGLQVRSRSASGCSSGAASWAARSAGSRASPGASSSRPETSSRSARRRG